MQTCRILLSRRSFHSSQVENGLLQTMREKIADRNKPVVSIIKLHGMIMSGPGSGVGGAKRLNMESTEQMINRAFKFPKLESVLLNVNSPGGSPQQSELIADFISQKAKEKNVPVITFVEDMAVSGGYWLACAGQKIFVTKTSVVGSIGVISASIGMQEFIKKYGFERRIHTAGKSKSFLDPFAEEKEEDVERLKALLSEVHETFKEHVRLERGDRIKKENEESLFNGEFFIGQKGIDIGLADGFGNINRYLKSEFGDRVQVKKFKPITSPLQQYFGTQISVEELVQELKSSVLNDSIKFK